MFRCPCGKVFDNDVLFLDHLTTCEQRPLETFSGQMELGADTFNPGLGLAKEENAE